MKTTPQENDLLLKSIERTDDLETNMNRQFQLIKTEIAFTHKRVDELETNMNQRLDKMDQRLDKMDQRLDKMDQKLENLDLKLDKLLFNGPH